jgi:TolA-binding protein
MVRHQGASQRAGALRRRLACLGLALACGGCFMSSSAGEQLQQEGRDRDRRIEQLEQQSAQNQKDVDQKLAELQTVLDKATSVLTHSSADVGAQVDAMREQLNTMDGLVAELKQKLEAVETQVATQRTDIDTQLAKAGTGKGALTASDIPADKASHFQAAYSAYTAGDQEKARSMFREYVTRYHDDAKAGEAQYWIAASYTQQNKPATALGEYRKVIAEFSKSGAVNVALYGMADAFYRLKACTDAKNALDALIKRKPESSLADRAKRLQKEVKTAGKSYCTS